MFILHFVVDKRKKKKDFLYNITHRKMEETLMAKDQR